jgi:cell division transport system permease protein
MRFQFIASELAIGLRRNVTMTIAAIVTITIAATLLGGALMVRDGAQSLQYEVLNQIEVSVYMQTACGVEGAPPDCLTPQDRTNIEATLKALPQVEQVTYISQEDAYKRFRTDFAGDHDLLNAVQPSGPNGLPESFAVKLRNPHDFAVVKSAVGSAPGVQRVNDASSVLKTLFSFFHKIELGVLLIALFLLAAAMLLIYNTMLVAAFTRRRETGIMRLVGASDFYIQAPFVLEGTVIGLIGTVLAVGLLALVRWFISSATAHSQVLRPFGTVTTFLDALPGVILIGILLPAIASFLTLRRHMRV